VVGFAGKTWAQTDWWSNPSVRGIL
jgi:hypothetical protein